MKELISKSTHDYGQRTRKAGAKYSATDAHAKFLVSRGVAAYATEEKKPTPATKPAEPKAAEKPVAKVMTVESMKGDEPKREYKRRDLTAEGSKE